VAGCGQWLKILAMRLHVGAHILRQECSEANGLEPSASEACGFCGDVCVGRNSGICKPELVKGSTSSKVVKSSCPFTYKMSLASASKGGSTANPCTNRPVPCQICMSASAHHPYAWSYYYLDHMQTAHPSQLVVKPSLFWSKALSELA
jgi:hypothetical protein